MGGDLNGVMDRAFQTMASARELRLRFFVMVQVTGHPGRAPGACIQWGPLMKMTFGARSGSALPGAAFVEVTSCTGSGAERTDVSVSDKISG